MCKCVGGKTSLIFPDMIAIKTFLKKLLRKNLLVFRELVEKTEHDFLASFNIHRKIGQVFPGENILYYSTYTTRYKRVKKTFPIFPFLPP